MVRMPKRLPADGVPSAAPYDRTASAEKATDALNSEIADLGDLDLYELRERWAKFYHRPAPRFFRRDLLIRGIAYEMQAKVFGGLSPKTRRQLQKIAAAAESSAGFTTADLPRRLRPGTRLVRAWKGVTHTVNVLEDGFEWQGKRYGSLSAIAKAISGTNWNGNTFFGLKQRKQKEAEDA
jgi:hypothetical protein